MIEVRNEGTGVKYDSISQYTRAGSFTQRIEIKNLELGGPIVGVMQVLNLFNTIVGGGDNQLVIQNSDGTGGATWEAFILNQSAVEGSVFDITAGTEMLPWRPGSTNRAAQSAIFMIMTQRIVSRRIMWPPAFFRGSSTNATAIKSWPLPPTALRVPRIQMLTWTAGFTRRSLPCRATMMATAGPTALTSSYGSDKMAKLARASRLMGTVTTWSTDSTWTSGRPA